MSLRKLILGFVLAWGLLVMLREMSFALAQYDGRMSLSPREVSRWRHGTPPVERLDRCLAGVRERVPPGRVVVFVSPRGPHNAEFFRWRWAAYLLPEHEVAPLRGPDTGTLAEYLVAYQRDFHHPRLELMAQLPECRLYRVRKP